MERSSAAVSENPGQKLKRARERLKMTYRDVERDSQAVAALRSNDEFAIALSRLADIENKGTVPTIYRLYSLSAIYRLDFGELLGWYGIPLEMLASDALNVPHDQTHAIGFHAKDPFLIPPPSEKDKEIDLGKTTFLSHMVRQWGKSGLGFLNGLDTRHLRFGLIGLEDWSMYPVLRPGSLVLIDEGRRRVAASGWANELDRPIYFLEHRDGYLCGWCSPDHGSLIVQPHPSSSLKPSVFPASEIDVLGQVTGVAMLLDPRRRRHPRGPAPAASPNP